MTHMMCTHFTLAAVACMHAAGHAAAAERPSAYHTLQVCHNSLALRLPAVACISPRLPDPIVMSWRNR